MIDLPDTRTGLMPSDTDGRERLQRIRSNVDPAAIKYNLGAVSCFDNFGRYPRVSNSLEERNQANHEPVRVLDMADGLAQLGNLLLRLPLWWLFGRSRSSASQATFTTTHTLTPYSVHVDFM